MIRLLGSITLLYSFVFAQPLELDPDVFAARRTELMGRMEPGSVAIFPARPVSMRNLDVDHDYRQESNFYYISGFEEPEAILLLNPAAPRYRFVMFVRKRDSRRETYDGPRAGVEGAMSLFRADTAVFFTDFRSSVYSFLGRHELLYYTFGINPEIDAIVKDICIEARSGINCPITDPAPMLAAMRLLKNEGDWRMGMQKAVDISVQAHLEAIRAIRPGMYEYEIQAVFESVYRRNGSPRNGYPCIIGSGPNSGILHYNKNTRKMQADEVVLMDCAAEYGLYSADITRTVPVDGLFSKEQREIYSVVLEAQNAGMNIVKPGIRMKEIDSVISNVLGKGLKSLGFIKDEKDYSMFTLHGYCHWIGLEVHDVGGYSENGKPIHLRPGMVFTIEPGIYVRPDVLLSMKDRGYSEEEMEKLSGTLAPYMNIGIRIEDDVIVTDAGCKNLSAGVPREIEELEELMNMREGR